MAMIQCNECGNAISDTAKSCPQCGGKVPRTKWWLWVPLGLLGVFLMIGFLTPEYVIRAREERKICKMIVAPMDKAHCDWIYEQAIREGQPPRAYVPTDDDIRKQKEKAEKDAADDVVEASVCQSKRAEMVVEFQRLMTARDYWPAVLSVRRCAQLTKDPKLTAMVADAEIRSYVMDIENPKAPVADRVRSIEALSRDYPERGKKYALLLKKLSENGSK